MALSRKQQQYIDKHAGRKSVRELSSDLHLDEGEVQAWLDENKQGPSTKKKALFFTLTLLIPVLFFVLLETGLRLADYRGNLDLFIYPESMGGEYGLANANFNSRYFFTSPTIPSASNDVFLKTKPENSFRVFVMGGSTTAGYPYGFNGTFSRVTADKLRDVLPENKVEVVNIGTSAINSYTLYDQIPEILEQKPDAIMIYAGHNEFYGALGVGSSESLGAFPAFVRFYLRIQRYKTFLLLRDWMVKAAASAAGLLGTYKYDESATLMQRMVRDQAITLDSHSYELGKRQFESNLKAILSRFADQDIPVFIGSLASNLKDHPPFVSLATEKHPPASEVFYEAEQAFRENKMDEAREKYLYAKDLDALKFRAPSEFNEIIRKLAAEYGAYYVPVEERLSGAAEHNIIGFDLMLEHLHPNRKGYFLIGKAFFEAVKESGFTGLDPDTTRLRDSETYYEKMEMSPLDERVAWHRIEFLTHSWPFVEEMDPRGYPYNYRPAGIEDSLAFEIVHRRLRWDNAKVQLAEHYERTGEFEKAFAEYRGFMRDQPTNDSPFVYAARLALRLNDLNLAKPYLEQAYSNARSNFTCRMLGALEVDAGNYDRGIALLQEALTFNENDAQALFNLSGAHALTGSYDKAMETLKRLETINPNFPGINEWRMQLTRVLESR